MFVRLIVIVAVFAVVVAWGARRSDSAGPEQVYVVQAGDSVWSIAAANYGGDIREAVWRLEDRNHLAGSLVSPGQKLRLP